MGSKMKNWWKSQSKGSKVALGLAAGTIGATAGVMAFGERACKGGSCNVWKQGGKVRRKNGSANAVPSYYDKGVKIKANLGWKQKLASLGVGAPLAGFTYALDRKSAKQREKDQG